MAAHEKMARFTVSVPASLMAAVKEEGALRGVGVSALVRSGLEREINRLRRERHLLKLAAEYAKEREVDGLEAVA